MKIYDRFGRPIENLRIVITTECNYHCIFCHSEGYYHCLREPSLRLSAEDIRYIGIVARRFEIDAVKITGGEPLLHPQILDIISTLRSLGFRDISLVTNGSLLSEYASKLKECGLTRINVSLVSLRESRYEFVTRTRNMLPKVLEGIKQAVEVGLSPVKINVVVLRGINDDELFDFIEFARKNDVAVQFIEYHSPSSEDEFFKRFYRPLDDLQEYLESNAEKITIRRMHNRRRYLVEGVEIELVRPMFNSNFCRNCIRIRATPTGWKPCLLRNTIVEYLEDLRAADLRRIAGKFIEAIHIRTPFFE